MRGGAAMRRKIISKLYSESTTKRPRDAQKFCAVALDMVRDPAWRKLSPRARCLYTEFCHMERSAPGTINEPGRVFPKVQAFQNNETFFLNWEKVKGSGLYSQRCPNSFYKDVQELIKGGFIECLLSGKNRWQKSVYKLSARWYKAREPPPG